MGYLNDAYLLNIFNELFRMDINKSMVYMIIEVIGSLCTAKCLLENNFKPQGSKVQITTVTPGESSGAKYL